MAAAVNYYRWLLTRFRPHLGRVVLEHGAGVGTFSTHLLEAGVAHLAAVEPARNLIGELEARLRPWGSRASIWPCTLEEFAARPHGLALDTIVTVNVLEHIEDDRGTLATMARLLPPRGRLVVFVPALTWLYGTLDVSVDHVRRYRREELVAKVRAAGFGVLDVRFMNVLGVATWFLASRVLRRRTLTVASVRIYDRWVIPVLRQLERLGRPPIGQNLLLVAERAA